MLRTSGVDHLKYFFKMITTIIKRNGDREAFDEDKLKGSIIAACNDADITEARTRELTIGISEKMMNNFGGKEEVMTSEMRDSIVNELELMEPAVADAWRKYETSKN
jgi:transcriptional regulator NrdR family protein